MKNTRNFMLMIVFIILSTLQLTAQRDFIDIRLSYKVIVDPISGNRPTPATDANIEEAVKKMNELQSSYARGYRFVITEIREVGWIGGQFAGPSQWYNLDFLDDDHGSDWKDDMETAAKNNKSAYLWRDNSINLYLNNAHPNTATEILHWGVCSFETANDNIIILGGNALVQPQKNAETQLHEIGHYFNLCHTQGCPCGDCESGENGICHTIPGDDNIDDTLPDLQCWNKDNIAVHAFRLLYHSLEPDLQKLVDDVHENIMSYHDDSWQLTEDQLDVWTQTANNGREYVTSGKNWIVAHDMGRLYSAHAHAKPNDLIVLKSGSYEGSITLDRPITVRASRDRPITLGAATQDRRSAFPEIIGSSTDEPIEQRTSVNNKELTIYPNPSMSQEPVHIVFNLKKRTHINMYIRNAMGQVIAEPIHHEPKSVGKHQIRFDASSLPFGLYFCVLENGSNRWVEKMVISK